ncbi:MAG: cytochrome c oxidase subunit II [Bacteroidetes bacterium]|nr:MAG: cytochrome c oxidase subunit II [Bacteroidota bacterium]
MFSNVSNFSNDVDYALAMIIGISLFFLVGLTLLMIYFMWRYDHKRNPKATDIEGHIGLEVLWTIVPTILVVMMFYYGYSGYLKMRTVPDDAIVIKATGQMWSWSFEYDNGKVTDTLVVPLDKAVKLNLFSKDVIHSLYIPAFRIKEDMVPGRDNWMWFIAQQEGTYNILCAEYCGDRHSYMISHVDVLPVEDYEKWYNAKEKKSDYPGLALMKNNACMSCHSVDGTRLVGPSFLGIWGRKETIVLENGVEKEIAVEREYLLRSLDDPNAELVKTYGKGMMQSYKDVFTEEEKEQIIDYLKSLK